MNLMTQQTALMLWQDLIKHAEDKCAVSLKEELEAYLISLLMRYTTQPDLVKQVFASTFLQALDLKENERHISLQNVGDQCLLFAGLFPRAAEKKQVKISYFVDLGRSSYANISHKTNDLFGSLALQFVVLMDILQSIPEEAHLLPLEAYEQWHEIGSRRAGQILNEYSKNNILPFKYFTVK